MPPDAKLTVYIESSVIGHVTGRTRSDPVVAGHQATTRSWWQEQRHRFELWISELVLVEISRGDPEAAAERLALVDGIRKLTSDPASDNLTNALVAAGALPPTAVADATHIALAAVNGMQYLVTWNCKHIANGEMLPLVEDQCRDAGYEPPRILTPEELFHGRNT